MVTSVPRYSIVQVRKICESLDSWIDSTQETLDNEESKDYPSDDRVDSLTERLEHLQAALEALQEIE